MSSVADDVKSLYLWVSRDIPARVTQGQQQIDAMEPQDDDDAQAIRDTAETLAVWADAVTLTSS